ncbi:hypothetical protein [Pseudoalteromonas rhizosphaerae]|uniref:hypothetical protein n=1 Tax=Pseudoalteromonas rhizosphaerae TaxID=2518973 RepID=UPI003850134E
MTALQAVAQSNEQTELHSSDVLTDFVNLYNAEQAQYEQREQIHALFKHNTQGEIAILKSQLEAEKRLTASQNEQLLEQSDDLKRAAEAIANAQKLANNTTAQQATIATLQSQLKAAQQSIRELNQLNPKKLKEQNKRQKEANEKAQARNAKLELEAKEYKKEIAALKNAVNQSSNLLIEQKRIIEHNTGAGLYHKGKDHLIIWPQKTKMQRPDGSLFEVRSLLYLHQSGRGGLINYDPETGAQLCAAPKGGLRLSDDTIDFAKNWLFKVNEQQHGIVHDTDMIPVNHNPDLQSAK